MEKTRLAAALALAFPFAWPAQAQTEPPAKELGIVTVTSGQPTSLPTQIPATMEGVTREQIEQQINATDSEDALKYLPSLLVRKRYIADYNHAVLSSRASGTGNSARTAVYADGILLSNYLGNGASYAPRWGLVTPEEIERVDVMYGPFSAAYPGNSAGAVVDYVTRMPTEFEAHAKAGYFVQPFDLYDTSASFRGWQTSASLGSKSGDWAWWFNLNRTESHGQPQTFATRLVSAGAPGAAGTPVSGAVPGLDRANNPWYILGTGTEYRTRQDHVKLKLAYELSPTLRASYTLGLWQNSSEGRPQSYLRNAAGAPVFSGSVNIDGRAFNLVPGDFGLSNESLVHAMHGLSVKSHTQGVFDWEAAASLYDYARDQLRAPTVAMPGALSGGAGTLQDQRGTGWGTLALKGTWRPQGLGGAHVVDFGYQQDGYRLRILKSGVAGNWQTDAPGALINDVRGKTQLHSVHAQDSWAFAPAWKAVLGARIEQWRASDGATAFSATNALAYPARQDSFVSPKAALSWQWSRDTVFKAATGRAVRTPTVSELYGATSTANSQFVNDPKLRPEKSWTSELSAEKDLGNALLRLTLFTENLHDALYSQTAFDPAAGSNITRVQNVGRIRTHGFEAAYSGNDVWTRGMDLNASLTYAGSRIEDNAGFVSLPGDTLGKHQPRVPAWRATALLSYRFDPRWTASLGARYSGRQFNTLNNSDVNGFAYMGTSKYFATDLRLRYQASRQWAAAFGIDNLNNYKYWNFHPYPQRSYSAELKLDL